MINSFLFLIYLYYRPKYYGEAEDGRFFSNENNVEAKEPEIEIKPNKKISKEDRVIPSSKANYKNDSDIFHTKENNEGPFHPIRSYHLESDVFHINKDTNSYPEKRGVQGYKGPSDIFHFKEGKEEKFKKREIDNNRETMNDPEKPQRPAKNFYPIKSKVFEGENNDKKNIHKNTDGQKTSEDNTLAHDFTGVPMREIKPNIKVFGNRKTMETEEPERRGKKIMMKRFEEDPRSLLANNFCPNKPGTDDKK